VKMHAELASRFEPEQFSAILFVVLYDQLRTPTLGDMAAFAYCGFDSHLS